MRKQLAIGIAAVLTTAGLLQSGPAQADPSPSSAAGADWVKAELDEYGLFDFPSFDAVDYGVNIDAGTALLWGGDRAGAVALRDQLEPGIDLYITGESFTPPDTGSTYASPLAKILAYVVRTGGDTSDYDGVDLVARLEAQVNGQGRIFDTSIYGDNANMIGQAFAAQSLHEADSAKVGPVLSYLLGRQCADGHFALDFPTEAVPNPCAGEAGVDVTALVALGLRSQANKPAVHAAISKAAAWVLDRQRTDGSFGGAPPTTTPNANTTGLAAWLLGSACYITPANRAAAWTRRLQVGADESDTELAGEVGAVAYDQAAFDAGAATGIGTTTADRDQWRRTTVQAAVGLGWHQTAQPSVTITGPTGFRRAGDRATYRIQGLDQDDQLPCLVAPDGNRMLTGTSATVTYPNRTGAVRYAATTGPGLSSIAVTVLAPKRLAPVVRPTVKVGRSQLVQVSGLVAGETVRVVYGSRLVATGKANAQGRYAKYFPVGSSTGTRRVIVRGHFATREGTTTFRVVR